MRRVAKTSARCSLILLAAIARVALAVPAHAVSEGAPAIYQPLLITSARAAGMGGVATIAGDGAIAVRHNPGFLVFGDEWELVTTSSPGYNGGRHRSTTVAGVFGDAKRVAIAGGYEHLDLGGTFDSEEIFDRVMRIGAAVRYWDCVGLGVTFEYAKTQIGYPSERFTGPSRGNGGASAGLGVAVARAIPLALGHSRTGSTILTPMFGACLLHWGGDYFDFYYDRSKPMPRYINVAGGMRITRDVDVLRSTFGRSRVPLYALTVGIESNIPANDADDQEADRSIHRYGAEFTLGGMLGGRLGYIDDEASDLHDTTFGFGLGIEGYYLFGLRLDYASLPQQDDYNFNRANVFNVVLNWRPPEIARE